MVLIFPARTTWLGSFFPLLSTLNINIDKIDEFEPTDFLTVDLISIVRLSDVD